MADVGGIYHWNMSKAVRRSNLKDMMDVMNHANNNASSNIWSNNICGLVYSGQPYTPEDFYDYQPYIYKEQNLVLVAEVRLDNRDALCGQLNISVDVRTKTPDSVLILKAYQKWKDKCPEYLLGDFAFALWDESCQKLLCARDARGTIPFFFCHQEGKRIAFSTYTKALFALPNIDRQLNKQTLADRLTNNIFADITQSFYHNIQQLPAAHLLVISPNGMRKQRYWEYQPSEIHYPCDEDYIDEFKSLFKQVISSRLRSINSVGAHISGGLDSTSVASVTAQLKQSFGQRLVTFTQVPQPSFYQAKKNGVSYDDRHIVTSVANQQTNIDPFFYSIEGLSPSHNLDSIFQFSDIPPLNAFNRLWIERIYEQAILHDIGGLLSGDAGNLTISLSVFKHYFQELVTNGQWQRVWQELKSTSKVTHRPIWRLFLSQVIKFRVLTSIAQSWQHLGSSTYKPWKHRSFIHPNFANEMNVNARLKQTGRYSARALSPKDAEKIRLRMLLQPYGQRSLFQHAYYRMYGVRTLDPTNDRRIVEFCLNLPKCKFFYQGWDRALIRRAMDHIPTHVMWNKKRGKQAADWMLCMDAAIPEISADLERMRRSPLASHILDLTQMQQTLNKWRNGRQVYQNNELLYRVKFMRGWLMGRFLLWEESQIKQK